MSIPDHFKKSCIKKLAYEKPTIKYVVQRQLAYDLMECGVPIDKIAVLGEELWYDFSAFKVKLSPLIHDVKNDAIHIDFGDYKVFYATDTSSIDHIEAKDYDMYFCEANYDSDEELDEEIKKAKEEGKFTHLERVEKTHLSKIKALEWLEKNMGENSQYVFIHQHIEKEAKDVYN